MLAFRIRYASQRNRVMLFKSCSCYPSDVIVLPCACRARMQSLIPISKFQFSCCTTVYTCDVITLFAAIRGLLSAARLSMLFAVYAVFQSIPAMSVRIVISSRALMSSTYARFNVDVLTLCYVYVTCYFYVTSLRHVTWGFNGLAV